MGLMGHGNEINGEIQLPNNIKKLIVEYFDELNNTVKKRQAIIEKEYKMAEKRERNINASDITYSIRTAVESTVGDKRDDFEKAIIAGWKRVIANELSDMGQRGVIDGNSMNIRQFINDFIIELKGTLQNAKYRLIKSLNDYNVANMIIVPIENDITSIIQNLDQNKIQNILQREIVAQIERLKKEKNTQKDDFTRRLDVTGTFTPQKQREFSEKFGQRQTEKEGEIPPPLPNDVIL